jgi:tetratricopeptide (TPR) repeat protein
MEFWTESGKLWKTSMRYREKVEPIHIILLIVGLVLFAGFIFIAVYFLKTQRYSRNLTYSLENVDDLINSGSYREAQRIIEEIEGFPSYPGDWLRLLKRCRLLAQKTGQPEIFSRAALRAQKAQPDNDDIAVAAAIALIDAGQAGQALFLAEKFQSLDFRSVAAEIFVRSSVLPPPAVFSPPAGGFSDELVYAVLPESGDYRDYILAGGLAEKVLGPDDGTARGFFLDAALLLLEAGKQEEALDLLSAHNAGGNPFLAALAAYDAGLFEKSGEYWELMMPEEKMTPRSLALRADTFLRQSRYAESKNIHEIFFYNFPDYSPVPYLAMNFLLHREAPFSDTQALRRGLSFFPGDTLLRLDYAKALVHENRTGEVEELSGGILPEDGIFLGGGIPPESGTSPEFEETRDISPELRDTTADFRLLGLIARRTEIPAGRLVSLLWMLRNDYPDSAPVIAVLRWYLFSLTDHAGTRQLLATGTAREDPFTGSYLAAAAFAEGDFDSASRELETAALFPACPEGFYNLGLVHSRLGQPEAALAAFRKADGVMEFAQAADLTEQISLREFDTLTALGRFSEAVAVIREFLEKHPGHPDALRKLRKLEATPE